MGCQVLNKARSSKKIKVVRKTFYICKFCGIYVEKENEKPHESTRHANENAKIHLGFRNRPSITFCN